MKTCAIVALLNLFFVVTQSKQWAIDSSTAATTLVGVSSGSIVKAVGAAASNGAGAFVERYDSESWGKTSVLGGLLLDAAVTKSGLTVATSMLQVFVSTDDGKTYSVASGVSGISQSANTFGSDGESIALVGSFISGRQSVSGVASTSDAGATWTFSSNVPVGYVRYGAFPSESTWYVSSGIWGEDAAMANSTKHMLTSRTAIDTEGRVSFRETSPLVKKTNTGATGWFGAVSKTTDGGKTWTQVFSTDLENDYLYFNEISCSTELNCMVVGEGSDSTGNYLTAVYATFDGGATWALTQSTNNVGMMGAKFLSETDGWIVGTSKSGRNLLGQFYRTTDGGKTFNLEQSLTNCFALDLDFSKDGLGAAACASSSGASCSVALYL